MAESSERRDRGPERSAAAAGGSNAAWVSIALGVVMLGAGGVLTRGAGPFDPDRALPVASMFDALATPAREIRDLAWLVIAICSVIFVVVMGLLVFAVWRYRERAGEAHREPPQVYGSAAIELAWTVVPIILVMVLGMVSLRTLWDIDRTTPPDGALEVTVVGHQWWWEMKYPEYGFTTANELHVPAATGENPRATFLRLESADVVHAFWIPQFNGKMDAVPGHTNTLWFDPAVPGTYTGQCTEYCGTQHANMLLRVIVHEPAEFATWAANERREALDVPAAAAGKDVFLRTACVNCHTVRGTMANGTFGPDLTHFMSRETLGSGAARIDRETLTRWVEEPEHIKPGVLMPAMQLSKPETEQLVEYLLTLK